MVPSSNMLRHERRRAGLPGAERHTVPTDLNNSNREEEEAWYSGDDDAGQDGWGTRGFGVDGEGVESPPARVSIGQGRVVGENISCLNCGHAMGEERGEVDPHSFAEGCLNQQQQQGGEKPKLGAKTERKSKENESKEDTAERKMKGGAEETEEQIMFSCNICYELASEPVVTLCGHLYCWPCLFRWLQVQTNCRTCPVCKAGVDRDKVIPVYGRGGNEDPRAKTIENSQIVPSRPTGQRPQPVDNRRILQQGNMLGGPNVLPSLFGFSQQPQGFADQLSPEQQHQAFLSRLLLMLGSFVIMCLLLF